MDGEMITQQIESAVDDLLGNREVALVPRDRALHVLRALAHHVQRMAEDTTLATLLTVEDVAYRLQISPRRVRARATWLNDHGHPVGWKLPRTNIWLFRYSELDILRTDRPAGRPRTQPE